MFELRLVSSETNVNRYCINWVWGWLTEWWRKHCGFTCARETWGRVSNHRLRAAHYRNYGAIIVEPGDVFNAAECQVSFGQRIALYLVRVGCGPRSGDQERKKGEREREREREGDRNWPFSKLLLP